MSASLHRSATRKAPNSNAATAATAAASSKKKKGYEVVQQGIKELYPLDKPNVSPDLDIVFVPGLGANPDDSWKSSKTDFNWTTHTDGLQRDFPRARLLLYMYDSAWTGQLKVKQFMGNIAMGLLVGLRSKRTSCQRRPIVFIGHSMGGLVIAKAITLTDSRRDLFPIMFEAITACVFFGAPFGGAPVAAVAAMYAHFAEKIDAATSSKLLDLMNPGDEELRQLKHDLMRLAQKGSQSIDLFCFWEEHPTDFSQMVGLPSLFGLTKSLIPKQYAEFVKRDSATLPGVEELGLACNHRDLVKFDGPKDERWTQMVRDPVKRIIHGAQLAVRNRLNSVRDIDRTLINGIMEALDGAQVQKKRKTLSQSFAPSTWIPREAEYTEWLGRISTDDEEQPVKPVDCIYLRGREGHGKTSATMATLEGIEKLIRENEEKDTGQGPILLAYFFCDATAEYCTAEDVLKAVIRQLINQQETLAPYAKTFNRKKGKDETSKTQYAQVTVENMWQSIQDMLADEFIGNRVFFVLNNLHALPAESASTIKLMDFIAGDLECMRATNTKRVPTRWFITSREAHNVNTALNIDGVRVIDLEDSKYENQVQLELRKHAKKMVSSLGEQKQYNRALAYFASSLIGRRAQNTQWIDITCIQLGELSDKESDLKVRKTLEKMPQDLKALLDYAWYQIFTFNDSNKEKIKELLRTLVLTFEDPTESELGILAGLASNDEEKAELRKLIQQCKPLLFMKRNSNSDTIVGFMNVVIKNHLRENAKVLLGLDEEETKWQHGVLSLRCFSHIKDSFDFPERTSSSRNEENAERADGAGEEGTADTTKAEGEDEATAVEDVHNDTEESSDNDSDNGYAESDSDSDDDDDPEMDIIKDKALAYTVKHWLHHASKATLEIAEDLSLEEDFWCPGSIIRRRWLTEFWRMTTVFDNFDHKSLTGLHVAASIGFRQLVAALIRNGHEEEIQKRDSLINTPLHFAAFLGRPNIVDELLNRGAVIDDAAEIQEQTPLHMAAFGGHVQVMKKLLVRGADPNAVAKEIGPVVNAAISSGNRAGVELLVQHNVSLTFVSKDENIPCPLAMAAMLADYSMFEYLIESYADKLPANDYSAALIASAETGRIEVFTKLLNFQHEEHVFQSALKSAVGEWNWDIVKSLLENCQTLDVNSLFFEAATCSEPQDKIVQLTWDYAKGSITKETLNNALYEATDREKTSTVKLLLQSFGADPNATGTEYGTALTAAAFDGLIEMVRLLLDAGADVNDEKGWALQTAATEGHYEVVEELINRGADVSACTTNPSFAAGTALQGACMSGKDEIVSLLLERGANPNLGLGSDSPPIVAATQRAEAEIVEMLVKAKADLDVFGGTDLCTPLINAAAFLPKESLQVLLDGGADINLPDNDGDTALIVAAARGDVEAVTFLLDNGADIMHSNKHDMNALQAAFAYSAVDEQVDEDEDEDNEDNGEEEEEAEAVEEDENQSENEDNDDDDDDDSDDGQVAVYPGSKEGQRECLGVLIERVTVLLKSLKKSIDSGNTIVANVVRSANMAQQGLSYDDEPSHEKKTEAVEKPEQPDESGADDSQTTKKVQLVDQPVYLDYDAPEVVPRSPAANEASNPQQQVTDRFGSFSEPFMSPGEPFPNEPVGAFVPEPLHRPSVSSIPQPQRQSSTSDYDSHPASPPLQSNASWQTHESQPSTSHTSWHTQESQSFSSRPESIASTQSAETASGGLIRRKPAPGGRPTGQYAPYVQGSSPHQSPPPTSNSTFQTYSPPSNNYQGSPNQASSQAPFQPYQVPTPYSPPPSQPAQQFAAYPGQPTAAPQQPQYQQPGRYDGAEYGGSPQNPSMNRYSSYGSNPSAGHNVYNPQTYQQQPQQQPPPPPPGGYYAPPQPSYRG